MKLENNKVTLSGEIASNFVFDHKIMGEGFYTAMLKVVRKSNNVDTLPIVVSDRLVDVEKDWTGQQVRVHGNFRSYNKHEGSKNHLVLRVFVREMEVWENDGTERPSDDNEIFLDGYICKPSICRKTPFDREVADVLIAVNRPYGKSDHIPSICWGRNARFADWLKVGTHITAKGRIQSREYQKKISEEEYETRTAYEVSINEIEVIEDADSEDKEAVNG